VNDSKMETDILDCNLLHANKSSKNNFSQSDSSEMKTKISPHFATSLLLPIDIDDLSYGRFFFKILQEVYPDLMPRKYGDTEPLKNVFDGDVEKMMSTCWQPKSVSPHRFHQFIWKPQLKGTLAFWDFSSLHGQQKLHSSLLLSGNPKKFRIADIKLFYREWIKHDPADIGHIHILAEPEFNHYKRYHNEMLWALNIGYTTLELKKYIPNLAWGMFFGRPYVEMMGLQKLLSAPAFLVEQWHDGVYIQVTENIEDTFKNYEEFDGLRTQIKKYLGRQYFFGPELTKDEYRVPNFNFH